VAVVIVVGDPCKIDIFRFCKLTVVDYLFDGNVSRNEFYSITQGLHLNSLLTPFPVKILSFDIGVFWVFLHPKTEFQKYERIGKKNHKRLRMTHRFLFDNRTLCRYLNIKKSGTLVSDEQNT